MLILGVEYISCLYGQLFANQYTRTKLDQVVKFLLNDTICEESNIESNMTLLRYLRENRALTGTKEGCASGDCGACTLLIGEVNDGELHYHSINSCITPLEAIAGKQVVTVEYLAGEHLHPSQAAMVAHDGSQCGFCTPGFVMSLAGLYEESKSGEQTINRHSVCEAISGNLCRCTGYRPIVDAGLAMDLSAESKLHNQRESAIDALKELNQKNHTTNAESGTHYFRPASEIELQALLKQNPKASIIAGGTDLMLAVTQQYKDLEGFIDIGRVRELTEIVKKDGKLSIGAAVTYTQLEHFFVQSHPKLYSIFERIASRQIRNRGTIGGNIANASPIADLPPILLALDACVVLKDCEGQSRTVPVDAFYHSYKKTELKTNEYISSIVFDEEKLEQYCDYFKVSKRVEDDISSVMLATRFSENEGVVEEARIAFGGMAATPIRVPIAEQCFKR